MVQRWTLYDPVDDETFTFAFNPAEGGTPEYKKTINSVNSVAPNGKNIFYQGANEPQLLEFSGVVLEQEQHDDFVTWASKQRILILTDDLDRSWQVMIESYSPKRVRRATRPYYHTYTMRCYVVS